MEITGVIIMGVSHLLTISLLLSCQNGAARYILGRFLGVCWVLFRDDVSIIWKTPIWHLVTALSERKLRCTREFLVRGFFLNS